MNNDDEIEKLIQQALNQAPDPSPELIRKLKKISKEAS